MGKNQWKGDPYDRPTRIYCLREPSDGSVRYVGLTRESIEGRLARHLDNARRVGMPFHVHAWIRSLGDEDPIVTLLENTTWRHAPDLEVKWIKYFRDLGCDLTNLTDGGEAGWGPAAWAAQATLMQDPEYRRALGKKISAAKKGVPMPTHQRDTWSAVMSTAWSGRPKSLAWRKAVSKLHTERTHARGYHLSESTRRQQSDTWKDLASALTSCVLCRKVCRGLPGISAHLWRTHKLRQPTTNQAKQRRRAELRSDELT